MRARHLVFPFTRAHYSPPLSFALAPHVDLLYPLKTVAINGVQHTKLARALEGGVGMFAMSSLVPTSSPDANIFVEELAQYVKRHREQCDDSAVASALFRVSVTFAHAALAAGKAKDEAKDEAAGHGAAPAWMAALIDVQGCLMHAMSGSKEWATRTAFTAGKAGGKAAGGPGASLVGCGARAARRLVRFLQRHPSLLDLYMAAAEAGNEGAVALAGTMAFVVASAQQRGKKARGGSSGQEEEESVLTLRIRGGDERQRMLALFVGSVLRTRVSMRATCARARVYVAGWW